MDRPDARLSRATAGRLALAAVPAVFLGLFFVYPLVSIVGSVIGDVSPGTCSAMPGCVG